MSEESALAKTGGQAGARHAHRAPAPPRPAPSFTPDLVQEASDVPTLMLTSGASKCGSTSSRGAAIATASEPCAMLRGVTRSRCLGVRTSAAASPSARERVSVFGCCKFAHWGTLLGHRTFTDAGRAGLRSVPRARLVQACSTRREAQHEGCGARWTGRRRGEGGGTDDGGERKGFGAWASGR